MTRRRPWSPIGALLWLALCGASGCAREAPKQRGPLVAKVGHVELHEDDVKRAIQREAGSGNRRFDTPEARRALIEELVQFELLAQAAQRAGLDKDPEAVHAAKQIAVTLLMNDLLSKVPPPESIPREELEQAYARDQATFTVPRAVHLRHLRVSDAALAEQLAAQAKALRPDDDEGFAQLARAHTEDGATRAVGGELGFVDGKSRVSPYLEDLLPRLTTAGQVVGPIRTHAGWEIVRVVSIRETAVRPFSEVEPRVRQRVYQAHRTRALEEYVGLLRQRTTVKVPGEGPAPATSR